MQGLSGEAFSAGKGKKVKSLELTFSEEVSNTPEMFSLEMEDLGEGKRVTTSTGQLPHACEVLFLSTPVDRVWDTDGCYKVTGTV